MSDWTMNSLSLTTDSLAAPTTPLASIDDFTEFILQSVANEAVEGAGHYFRGADLSTDTKMMTDYFEGFTTQLEGCETQMDQSYNMVGIYYHLAFIYRSLMISIY